MLKITFCLLAILFSANFCYATDSGNSQSFTDKAVNYVVIVWQIHVFPFIKDVWVKGSGFLTKEIDSRPDIKNKLESEKKEVGEEAPQLLTPIWERIRGIIK
jgi:hypothetical protein